MKTTAPYGFLKLSARLTREIQLEWDMVEASPAMPRFMNFPCRDVPAQRPRRTTRAEKRPLAA